MNEALQTAIASVSQPDVLLVILCSAAYGIFVGAIPGLTATMAVALMVPLTFFLSDIQAVAAIVTTVTCSIFAGDIPATLIRIPGTPASAAYAADAYKMTRQGEHQHGVVRASTSRQRVYPSTQRIQAQPHRPWALLCCAQQNHLLALHSTRGLGS